MHSRTILRIYELLLAEFGPQHWWPATSRRRSTRRLEVAVGAILTQNTAWVNAARAVQGLRSEKLLNPSRLSAVSRRRLASVIRSSGYFNQKARRLKAFARYLQKNYKGRMDRMRHRPADQLRKELLSLHGIGPETADSILLYALDKPAFVVDAYTRRALARHSLIPWEATYDQIQSLFVRSLPSRVPLWNEYHALLVRLGKDLCRPTPLCHQCPLRRVGKLRLEATPASPEA